MAADKDKDKRELSISLTSSIIKSACFFMSVEHGKKR